MTKFEHLCCVSLIVAIPGSLAAQTPMIFGAYPAYPIPNDRSSMAPGIPAVIECSGCSGAATVQVGGFAAPVLRTSEYYDSVDLYVQLPTELTPGTRNVVVISGGATSDAFPVQIEPFAPGLISGRLERGLSDGRFATWSCAPGQTPKTGDLMRVYGYGLGTTDPVVATGAKTPAAPLAKTVATPTVTIGGQSAEIVESVLSPGEIGVYRVTFKVPAVADGWYDVSLSAGGKITIPDSLGVGSAIKPSFPYQSARESIQTASACGSTVANPGQTLTGDARNPLTNLGGIGVKVKDARGIERAAQILSAASDQLDYIVPSETANGPAVLTITTTPGTILTGTLDIQNVSPRALRISPTVPAAVVVRVRDGAQTVEQIYKVNAKAPGGFELTPIDLGPETDRVYLVLFGTGWRFRKDPTVNPAALNVSMKLVNSRFGDLSNAASAPADYAGPQGEFAGIDQMNVPLPRSLAGQIFNLFIQVDDKVVGVMNGLTFN